ncbi:hypothetical protein, partial [Amorphus sp. 3PC139-8]|uniref:hypothetical protein n=1 Tax=Amorphus sp. 3PC139-8 TaxID=2735676 RepID=UPI00345C9A00
MAAPAQPRAKLAGVSAYFQSKSRTENRFPLFLGFAQPRAKLAGVSAYFQSKSRTENRFPLFLGFRAASARPR